MNEVVIRKENYGFLIFVPDEQSYYRVYDEQLKEILLNSMESNSLVEFAYLYPELYIKFNLDKYNFRFVDNSTLGYSTFVPLEVYFDYTAKCNANCTYCYNKKYLGDITMPIDEVRKIFDDMYDLGIMRVHLAGGEPTIDYEGLKNYIEYARSKSMIISMATNGSYLTEEVCELLTTNDLFSVSISLDSIDEEINDQLRGKGSYKRAIKGFYNLYKSKLKNNSPLKICFKPVYYPDITIDLVESIINFSQDNNIDILKFANPERCEEHPLGYYGNIKTDYYDNIKQIQNIINNNQSNMKITNVSNPILYDFIIGIEENKGCIGAQELLTINPDGRITPCLMNHTLLGNIYDFKSIKDFLVNSKELLEYRRKISSYNCDDCSISLACRGGCQVRKKVEYGEIKGIDPLCPKELVKKKINNNTHDVRKINVYHSL